MRLGPAPRALAIAALASLAGGCGGRAAGGRDGGPATDGTVGPPPDLQAFVVTAFLTSMRDGGAASFPPMNAFTLVLDRKASRLIVGGGGRGAVVPVTTADGRTFETAARFSVGAPDGSPCGVPVGVDYETLAVTIAGAGLEGRATGAAQISCGDCIFAEPFSAQLGGVADVRAPFLVGGSGTAFANPFDPFSVLASEPLPTTATARLVAGDGSAVDLLPVIVEGTPPLIVGFTKPDVVLRPGEGYTAAVDGLIDFAGRSGARETPLRLTAFAAAPLVPEDGFESAMGASFGGALIIRGGPVPPIAGAQSLYVGVADAPSLEGIAPGKSLDVRLALRPGVTKVRFSYRVVAHGSGALFRGSIRLGSVGHAPAPSSSLPRGARPEQVILPSGRTAYVSPVATAELDLPADLGDEIVVSISTPGNSCDGVFLPEPSAILVDDLALE